MAKAETQLCNCTSRSTNDSQQTTRRWERGRGGKDPRVMGPAGTRPCPHPAVPTPGPARTLLSHF